MYIDRFPSLSKRYGRAVMDRLQTLIARELGERIYAPDRLFQWAPGSFLVLFERTDAAEAVQTGFRRLASIRGGRTIEVEDRSLVLPLILHSYLLPVFEMPSADAIAKRLDAFLAEYADR